MSGAPVEERPPPPNYVQSTRPLNEEAARSHPAVIVLLHNKTRIDKGNGPSREPWSSASVMNTVCDCVLLTPETTFAEFKETIRDLVERYFTLQCPYDELLKCFQVRLGKERVVPIREENWPAARALLARVNAEFEFWFCMVVKDLPRSKLIANTSQGTKPKIGLPIRT